MALIDGLNRHARSVIRVAEIRGVLLCLVSQKKLIHYAALADIFHRFPDKAFMDDLATIARHNETDGQPLLTAIVYGKRNAPSNGFFDHARRIGALEFAIDRERFWLEQLHALGYDIVAMANGNTTEEFPQGLAALAEAIVMADKEDDVCEDCGFSECVCPDDPVDDDEEDDGGVGELGGRLHK